MTDDVNHAEPLRQPWKRSVRRLVKPQPSALEKLTPDELQTLRLDTQARAELDALVQRFTHNRVVVKVTEREGVASMDEARYDQHSTAEAEHHGRGMAIVHFMAPRILKLREGAAKRKWRSFLTKFRKDEKLN